MYKVQQNEAKAYENSANIWIINMGGGTPDFWGRGPRFESGISHSDPDALQDRCAIM